MSQFKRWDKLIETVEKEWHAEKFRTAFSVSEKVQVETRPDQCPECKTSSDFYLWAGISPDEIDQARASPQN